ncbi:MAG: hypothetical protein IKB22_06040 [Lentisphaeria bacterium]|nr:hypothetical protein [Lentisphaeria bacterium]
MSATKGKVCLNHTSVPAAAICAACGKPICVQCIVPGPEGSYCSQECRERGTAAAAVSQGVLANKAKDNRKAKVRAIIIVIILLALGCAGYYYYINNKDEVEKHLETVKDSAESGVNMVKGKSHEIIDDTKKSMDKDSKYKRDREGLVK